MAAFIALAAFFASITAFTLIFMHSQRETARMLRDPDLVRRGNEMARLLDAALVDPMVSTTERWRRDAKNAAARWFNA